MSADAGARGLALQAKAAITALGQRTDRRVALFGDSMLMQTVISGNGSAAAGDAATGSLTPAGQREYDYTQVGLFSGFQQIGGHRLYLDPLLNKAIGGDTTGNMLARYPADIAANYASFDWLWMNGGTNDTQTSVPTSTTIANLKTMIAAALAAGKKVVWIAIPPRSQWSDGPSGTVKTQRFRAILYINAQMQRWARTLPTAAPFWIIDAWADLSDPANAANNFSSGSYTLYTKAFWDSILHPSGLGSYVIGKRALAELGSALPNTSWRSRGVMDGYDASYNPSGNGLPNLGFLTTTGGTNNASSVTAPSGIPASWRLTQAAATGSATIVASEVTYTTASPDSPGYGARLGNLPQIAVSMASGKANVIRVTLDATSGVAAGFFTPGQTIYGVAVLRCTGLQGFAGASAGFYYTPDGTTFYRRSDGAASHGYSWSQDDQTITLVTPELTIPADVQSAVAYNFSVGTYWDATTAAASGTCKISDVQWVAA